MVFGYGGDRALIFALPALHFARTAAVPVRNRAAELELGLQSRMERPAESTRKGKQLEVRQPSQGD